MVRSSRLLVALSGLCILPLAAQQSPPASDTVQRTYEAPVVTVTTTRAVEGRSPVTWNELERAEIRQQYTTFDLPTLLSELPSTMFVNNNGNAIGYSSINIRGFDQRRVAVLVNGIPQNDPEDHGVYWINMPDLAASLEGIQVQRGAGLANYGSPAIGGSVNMVTINPARERFIRGTVMLGVQEFRGGGRSAVPPDETAPANDVERLNVEFSSGLFAQHYGVYARLSRIRSRGYRDYTWSDLPSYFVSVVRFDEQATHQINIFGGPFADGLNYTGVPKAYVNDPVRRRTNYSYWEYGPNGDSVAFAVLRRPQELENFSQPHYELLSDIQLSSTLTLKSSLFYYTGDGFFDFDGSWADATMLRLVRPYAPFDSAPNPANAIIRAFVANRHGGWIPRLVWQHEGGELLVGAELRWHRSEHWGKIRYAENLPPNYDPDYKFYSYEGVRDIYSFFVREQYMLTSTLLVNLEAQLVRTRYGLRNERAGTQYTSYLTMTGDTVRGSGMIFDVWYTFLNPRLGVRWNLAEEQSFYATVAYTSREPRRNSLYRASESYVGYRPTFYSDTVGGVQRFDFSRPLVKPERLLDIEAGWNWRSANATAAVTLYWMEFFDELVSNGQRDIWGAPVEGNAPRARHLGIELSGAWSFLRWNGAVVTAGGNLTLSRNRFIDYTFQAANGQAVDLSGNPIEGFPEFLANIFVDLQWNGFALRWAGRYVGPHYTDNFGARLGEYLQQVPGLVSYRDNRVDPYFVANLTASYTLTNIAGLRALRLRMQVNNLFNSLFAWSGNGAEFFPAAERLWLSGIEVEL
ncbi:MAG: TonB-dependent receptor [Bacteroidota bacterium]|nr:TonB-dependent receptor [Bacteroidota bacterium]